MNRCSQKKRVQFEAPANSTRRSDSTVPFLLRWKEAVKGRAGTAGYFICLHHRCEITDEIKCERLPASLAALQRTKVPATSAQLLSRSLHHHGLLSYCGIFLLRSASKREIEMLLFTVVRTFQEPVHDAVESILKSLLHFFFCFFIAHSLFRLQSAAEVACRTGGGGVKLKNGAKLPRRTPLNQSVIAGYKTESKTRRFHSHSCE